MTRDEYVEDVRHDIVDKLQEMYVNGKLEEVDFSNLDNLDVDDFEYYYYDLEYCLTGDVDGSYFCNRYSAQKALDDIIWDTDVLCELHNELGFDIGALMKEGPEAFDVFVRSVVFNEAWQLAVNDFIEDLIESSGAVAGE